MPPPQRLPRPNGTQRLSNLSRVPDQAPHSQSPFQLRRCTNHPYDSRPLEKSGTSHNLPQNSPFLLLSRADSSAAAARSSAIRDMPSTPHLGPGETTTTFRSLAAAPNISVKLDNCLERRHNASRVAISGFRRHRRQSTRNQVTSPTNPCPLLSEFEVVSTFSCSRNARSPRLYQLYRRTTSAAAASTAAAVDASSHSDEPTLRGREVGRLQTPQEPLKTIYTESFANTLSTSGRRTRLHSSHTASSTSSSSNG